MLLVVLQVVLVLDMLLCYHFYFFAFLACIIFLFSFWPVFFSSFRQMVLGIFGLYCFKYNHILIIQYVDKFLCLPFLLCSKLCFPVSLTGLRPSDTCRLLLNMCICRSCKTIVAKSSFAAVTRDMGHLFHPAFPCSERLTLASHHL